MTRANSAPKMFAVKPTDIAGKFDGVIDLIPIQLFWNHQSCFFSFTHAEDVKMEEYKRRTLFLKFTFICFKSATSRSIICIYSQHC